MSYVHCHGCGWSQDDFWDESYNPIDQLKECKDILLYKDLDEERFKAHDEYPAVTHREYVLSNLKSIYADVATMEYPTRESWSGKPCPKCGHGLCED
jgi:hypothetical protein